MSSKNEHGGGKVDNEYCSVCCDSSGALMSFKEVHERMTTERFMKVQGMPRKGAEDHADRALKAMPAWKHFSPSDPFTPRVSNRRRGRGR